MNSYFLVEKCKIDFFLLTSQLLLLHSQISRDEHCVPTSFIRVADGSKKSMCHENLLVFPQHITCQFFKLTFHYVKNIFENIIFYMTEESVARSIFFIVAIQLSDLKIRGNLSLFLLVIFLSSNLEHLFFLLFWIM